MSTMINNSTPAPLLADRLRRLGLAGVLFFTIKGLLWLAVPYFLAQHI